MVISKGRVVSWNPDEGWGVIEAESTPGGCWLHVSSVLCGGQPVIVGQELLFTFEQVNQDGFRFRVHEAWTEATGRDRSHQVHTEGPSEAYASRLRLASDEDPRFGVDVEDAFE